ncbi:hypothetical protein Tco_0405417 [Tanacetum coccineum]
MIDGRGMPSSLLVLMGFMFGWVIGDRWYSWYLCDLSLCAYLHQEGGFGSLMFGVFMRRIRCCLTHEPAGARGEFGLLFGWEKPDVSHGKLCFLLRLVDVTPCYAFVRGVVSLVAWSVLLLDTSRCQSITEQLDIWKLAIKILEVNCIRLMWIHEDNVEVTEHFMARSGTDLKMAKLVMSSPNHSTSDIEDAFSSNFSDYIPASPDYVPASPGNTYPSSSNNSFGLVPIASPTLSLFHDDPYMKVMHLFIVVT